MVGNTDENMLCFSSFILRVSLTGNAYINFGTTNMATTIINKNSFASYTLPEQMVGRELCPGYIPDDLIIFRGD
jgi:hypothetical protein